MAAINVFINRAPVQRNFFLYVMLVIKPMEKSRKNESPRFDTFWGGG